MDRAGTITTTSSGDSKEECKDKATGALPNKAVNGDNKEEWEVRWEVDTWVDRWEEDISNGSKIHSTTKIKNGVKEATIRCLIGKMLTMFISLPFNSTEDAKNVMELEQYNEEVCPFLVEIVIRNKVFAPSAMEEVSTILMENHAENARKESGEGKKEEEVTAAALVMTTTGEVKEDMEGKVSKDKVDLEDKVFRDKEVSEVKDSNKEVDSSKVVKDLIKEDIIKVVSNKVLKDGDFYNRLFKY